MFVSGSVATPKTQRTPRTKNRTKLTTGANIKTKIEIGPDTRIAAVSALVIAYVLGSTSANTSTKNVITRVANTIPFSPISCVNSAVIRAVASILTKLLPNNTEPIKRSLSLVTFKARSAPAEPLLAFACNLLREAAVNAVSEPEKNPDNIKRIKIAPTVIQNPLSNSKYSIMRLFLGNVLKDGA